MANTGYCMKCKKKVEMLDENISTTNKGLRMAKGKCPDCGTTVCAMLGK